MKVLIVIVTYNGMRWVERCLGSILASLVKADAFVVDNGSTDGTQEYIQQHYPETIFQQSKANLGFGKANNVGIQYAIENDYDYVYLLNQDAWIMPETIGTLIEVSKKNSGYGILSPFQMSADLYHIDENFYRRMVGWNNFHTILNDIYSKKTAGVYEAKSVMAAHWFMTRECINKVGGFSPSFPHYGEDDNYSDRVRYLGFKIGFVPSLKVVHDRAWREDTPQQKIYKGYAFSIYMLSNPEESTFSALKGSFKLAIRNMWHYQSIKPVVYLWRICTNLHSIIQNKKLSMETNCAFIESK